MFNSYMTDTIVLISRSGAASWGIKGTSRTTLRARVEDKNILIRNAAGEDMMLKAIIYLKERPILLSDYVEIDGVAHPILTIKKNKAFSKTVIMEIGIG